MYSHELSSLVHMLEMYGQGDTCQCMARSENVNLEMALGNCQDGCLGNKAKCTDTVTKNLQCGCSV